jgi:S1-C subfamily serine protease
MSKKNKIKSILSKLPAKKESAKDRKKENKKDADIKKILKKHKAEDCVNLKTEKARLGFSRTVLILFIALIIGGLGGIFSSNYLFPYLASFPALSKFFLVEEFNQKTVVINPTQEVIVENQKNILPDAIKKASPALVGIFNEKNEFLSSGIVLTADGLVLTPNVNLTSEENYIIKTQNQNSYEAKFISSEIINQISALKINKVDNLPVATLADTQEIEVGDTVIGLNFSSQNNPSFTVQPSFLSFKKNHSLNDLDTAALYTNALRLLGPSQNMENTFLVNENGEILGTQITLNEQKYFNDIENLRNLIHNLNRYNRLSYPQFGFKYKLIDEKLAQSENLPVTSGLLITEVFEEQAAEKADLETKDIITQIGLEKISPETNLIEILKSLKPQDKIKLKVIKGDDQTETETEIILE